MERRNPTVSIGMPVYNGERYIGDAIRCHLDQTFEDIEIIVSDNASTDGTADVIAELAAKDSRIRFIQQPFNIGANRNYNAVLASSTGEFFRWAAHDDVVLPTYLEKCVALLRDDPRVTMAHCRGVVIDGNGDPYIPFGGRLVSREGMTMPFPEDPRFMEFASSERPRDRFRSVAFHYRLGDIFYGLGRRSAWKKTRGQLPFYGADKIIIAEMALQGPFAQVPEQLFHHRFHQAASTWMKAWSARSLWSDPSAMPGWHPREMFSSYAQAIRAADISETEKLWCMAYLVRKGLRSEELAKVVSPDSFAHLAMLVRLSLGRAPGG